MKKRIFGIITIYLLLIGICAFMVYVIPSIKGLLVQTYIAEQGEIVLDDETDLYILRDEKVYKAPRNGKVKRLAKSGKLYRAGTKIVEFKDENGSSMNKRSFSQNAGYVVYTTDGAEKRFKPKKIRKIKKTEYEKISSTNPCSKGDIVSGSPMYKIVRNGKFNLVFFVEKSNLKKYLVGNYVQIDFGNETIKAYIDSISKGKAYARVVLKSNSMFKGCLEIRKKHCKIIAASSSGLVLKDESIIKKKGKLGVIVKNKMGDYVFKRICIKADDGERCVVYQDVFMDNSMNFVETLKIYDEVVEKPTKEDIKKSE